jgi:hypothetical protein
MYQQGKKSYAVSNQNNDTDEPDQKQYTGHTKNVGFRNQNNSQSSRAMFGA